MMTPNRTKSVTVTVCDGSEAGLLVGTAFVVAVARELDSLDVDAAFLMILIVAFLLCVVKPGAP